MWLIFPIAVHAIHQVVKCTVSPHIFYDKVVGGGRGGGVVFEAVGFDPTTCQSKQLAVKFNSVKSQHERHLLTKQHKPWTLKKVDALREYEVLSSLAGTKGVVGVLGLVGPANGVFQWKGEELRQPGLVMDYISGQNLTHYIQTTPVIDEKLIDLLFRRAVEALMHVWEHGFYQGDAHTGNFIISTGDNVVLIDFGYSGKLGGPKVGNGIVDKVRDLRTLCNHFEHHLENRLTEKGQHLKLTFDSHFFKAALSIQKHEIDKVHKLCSKAIHAIRSHSGVSFCTRGLKEALTQGAEDHPPPHPAGTIYN